MKVISWTRLDFHHREEQPTTFFFYRGRSLSPTKPTTATRNRVARGTQKKTRNQFQSFNPIPCNQLSNHMAGTQPNNSTRLAVVRTNQPSADTHRPGRRSRVPDTRAGIHRRTRRTEPSLTRADAGVGGPPEPHLLDDEAGPDEGARRHREDQALGVVRRHAPASPGRRGSRRRHLLPPSAPGSGVTARPLTQGPTTPPPPPPPPSACGV